MDTPAVSQAYLSRKLTRPLPTKDGGTLRTVLDARAYMLRLSKDRERSARLRARPPRPRSPKAGGGSSADDKPPRRAGSAFCASMGSHILHPVGRSGGHIRACPYSLVASRVTTGRAKRLPSIPVLASAIPTEA